MSNLATELSNYIVFKVEIINLVEDYKYNNYVFTYTNQTETCNEEYQ